jgi:uncharacterized protein YjiS (DUF1127 family)
MEAIMVDCIDTKSGSVTLKGTVRPHTGMAGAAIGTIELLFVWVERVRQRRALASLDRRMLRDIGLDPGTAFAESRKPFWRA